MREKIVDEVVALYMECADLSEVIGDVDGANAYRLRASFFLDVFVTL